MPNYKKIQQLLSEVEKLKGEIPRLLESSAKGMYESVSQVQSLRRSGRGSADMLLAQRTWRKTTHQMQSLETLMSRITKAVEHEPQVVRRFYTHRGMWTGAGIGFMTAYASDDSPSLTKIVGYTVGGAVVGRRIGAYMGEARIRSAFPDAARIKQYQARFGVLTRRLSGIQSSTAFRNILNV